MQSLTRQEAAKELLWLDRAASSVLNFAGSVEIPGQPYEPEPDLDDPDFNAEIWNPTCEQFHPITTGLALHHILLLKELDKVIDYLAWKHFGDLEAAKRIDYKTHDRTLVFMPPGSAKSTYASVVTPAYAMGRLAGLKVLLTSYATGIAKKQGRKGRALCRNEDFIRIFETELSKESSAANEWALTNGSEYMSGGILSGLTGNRSHLNIFDDPIKGRQDADSEVIRENTYDAYMEDFMTRLMPNGAVFGIQTRWHEDDLSGRILPDNWDGESGLILCKDGKYWNVICLPAICDRKDDLLGRKIGEPLWPEWFTAEHFAPFMKNSRTWNSLFQQKPTPDDGTQFKKEYFQNRWRVLPSELNYYMSGDYAVTEDGKGNDPDFTCIGVWGVDPSGICYLVDWFIGKEEIDSYLEIWISFVKRYKPFWHRAEMGIIRRSIEPSLKKIMLREKAFTTLQWSSTTGSKTAKARGFQVLASNDQIRFPYVMKDAQLIHDQLIKFPAGRHDDAVDMCSEFAAAIHKAWEATVPTKKEERPKLKKGMIRAERKW